MFLKDKWSHQLGIPWSYFQVLAPKYSHCNSNAFPWKHTIQISWRASKTADDSAAAPLGLSLHLFRGHGLSHATPSKCPSLEGMLTGPVLETWNLFSCRPWHSMGQARTSLKLSYSWHASCLTLPLSLSFTAVDIHWGLKGLPTFSCSLLIFPPINLLHI